MTVYRGAAHDRASLRGVRISTTGLFALNGFLCGLFTSRLTSLVETLGLSTVDLGWALFVWGVGSVAVTWYLRRSMAAIGSARVLRIAGPAYAIGFVLVALAPSYLGVLASVAVFGTAYGACEVAAAVQGSAVERGYGRPLMGTMHAGWPVGAALGGLGGALSAHVDLSFLVTIGGAGLLAVPVAVLLGRGFVAVAQAPQRGRLYGRRRVRPVVYILGVVALTALVMEGVVTDWGALAMHTRLDVSYALAALAYPAAQAGMITGRVCVDQARRRYGPSPVLMLSGVLVACGMLLVAVADSSLAVLAGLYVAGAAVGPMMPIAFSLAGASEQDDGSGPVEVSESAIAHVGVMGFLGIVAGPPLIGTLAGGVELAPAMAIVAVVCGLSIVAAGLAIRPRAGAAGPVATVPSRLAG